MTMRLTYDKRADALAVELAPDAKSVRTKQLAPDLMLDFDAKGRLITVEILGASAQYPLAELERLTTPVTWLSLREAAVESGLGIGTLRVMLNNGRLDGEKRGRDWVVSYAVLLNYMENRKPVGRPAKKRKARRPKAKRHSAAA